MQAPRFTIQQIDSNRWQINELWPDYTGFIGIRTTYRAAVESCARMEQEYRDAGYTGELYWANIDPKLYAHLDVIADI
jgi:hypothetical protein